MQTLLKGKNNKMLRLKKGEELISSLTEYCEKEEIAAGHFAVIGAAGNVTISYYNLETKKYQDKTFTENVEILNITGNIAVVGSDIRIHAHGSFARSDYSVFGGHVQKCVISATGEIHFTKLGGKMKRTFDEETGLFLLSND